MREGNEVLRTPVELELPTFADNVGKRVKLEKLRDREFPDRQDEPWTQDFELAPQPVRTFLDLVLAGNTIAAARVFAGKAAADCREVDPAASRFLVPSECGLEPVKKRLASRPREWASEQRFLDAGRLADQKDPAGDGPADDHGFVHAGASLAAGQRFKVNAQGAHDQPKRSEAI
jgi:hypothetical protein